MTDKPESNGEKIERNPDGTIKKGSILNPNGRPKGSVSIKDQIKQRLRDNPEKMMELVDYYMETEQPIMRKLLWEMIDGKPQQAVDMKHDLPQTLIELIKHGTTQQGGNKEVSGEDSE